jgi:hypothetical protein
LPENCFSLEIAKIGSQCSGPSFALESIKAVKIIEPLAVFSHPAKQESQPERIIERFDLCQSQNGSGGLCVSAILTSVSWTEREWQIVALKPVVVACANP